MTVQPPVLRPGDYVEIQTGPFRGLHGVFEQEMSGRERIVVLLEILSRAARVEVDRGEVERL